ncbi:MAG: hypothetical protein M1503_06555 [Thaumarchaeota archaeon]|nr:hypothetical protein [Nitrososphaerota archaeon]MCL5317903.1 hypothetical protein [Nitrososphaerota archaeon]
MDSRAAMFLTREGATYLFLTLPALMVQATYSIAIYSTAPLSVAGIPPPFNLIPYDLIIRLIGAAALIIALVSIAMFRPTLNMLTLGASYFIITLLPHTLTTEPLILLISIFLLMISFNYGRTAQTVAGRKPIISSTGPFHLKILSVSLSWVLPVAAAVALVAATSLVAGLAQSESTVLPYPLADLVRLYLQTRIGFVLLATAAAGVLLWIIREFLEPAILYYSLDSAGARQMLIEEYNYEKQGLEKRFLRRKIGSPIQLKSPSQRWIIACAVLASLLLMLFGPTPSMMAERSGLASSIVPKGLDEEALLKIFSAATHYIDSKMLQVENLIRYFISLLWGG